MLEISKLSFGYDRATPLFQDLDFRIERPGFYSLFGRSGCGKSTLGKIVSARLPAQATRMQIPQPALYASDTDQLPPWGKLGSHLRSVIPPQASESLADFLSAARVGSHLLDRRAHQLSQGQLQRLNMARFLLQQFGTMVLDEAITNVDQSTRWAILGWVREAFKSRIILYITHEVDDVLTFSDAIFVMRPGIQLSIEGIVPMRNSSGELADDDYIRLKKLLLAA